MWRPIAGISNCKVDAVLVEETPPPEHAGVDVLRHRV